MDFKGCNTPEIYVLTYGTTEYDTQYPLSGPGGNFLCSLLGSFGKFAELRFASWTGQGVSVVANDIIKCNPKVIVGVGEKLPEIFFGAKRPAFELSGQVTELFIKGKKFPYVTLMDPELPISDKVKTSKDVDVKNIPEKFARDLYKAVQIANGTFYDIYKEKSIMNAHSYEEFVNIYDMYFLNDTKLSYDIETNARPAMTEDSKIIGFSIGNSNAGVYVSVESAEWKMDEDEEDKIWSFLINEVFNKKDKLIIHNTQYERPYTYCCKGYEIGFDKAEDTLVLARMLKDPGEKAGLKYQAQKYLDFPDWETDLMRYIKAFKLAVGKIGFGPQKFIPVKDELFETKDIFNLKNFTSYTSLKNEKDKQTLDEILYGLYNPCVELYSEEELSNLSKCISEKLIETIKQGGIKDSTIPYNYVPDKVLSSYGALDSISTSCLFDYFSNIMDTQSTDKIDLHKGYNNWLEHMYVAYIMERNGMYWDDSLVKQDVEILNKVSINSLKELIKSPLFEKHIAASENKYKPLLLSDYFPQVAASFGYKVIYNKDDCSYKMTSLSTGKKVAAGMLDEISVAGSPYEERYYGALKTLLLKDVDKATNIEELKTLFNPMSSDVNGIARDILLTADCFMGTKINQLKTLSESPDFETIDATLTFIEKKIIKLAVLLCNEKELKKTFGENWGFQRKSIYNSFCLLYNNNKKDIKNKDIKEIMNKRIPLVVDTFDDDGIISIYTGHVVTGIDPDNKETWTEQFKWLANFRLCKKALKLLTTYIDGSVGRQSVYVVDKDLLKSGEHRLKRLRNYTYEVDGLSEDYLLASKWSPNTAHTGRWKSGFHTLPWSSPVKRYYSSRFVGGTIVAPDYSTMEVRTLAGVSHDEGMLQLFRDGKDFHTETAAKIYHKPPEEVTASERRFSKAATFSLLYGSSVGSFAKKYCKNDMEYANMVFDGFFKAYPNAEKWVNERHEEVAKDNRVSLELSQRFIPIKPEGPDEGSYKAMLRKAQNYPIQAQSADLTGGVVFDLQKYIEDTNKKSLIFMYVHDSIETDIYPFEMLEFITHLKWLLNEAPERRMGLPSKADVTLGKSLGHEIELESIECNDDYTEGTLVLCGYRDEIEDTIENWKKAYKTVEISEEEWEDDFFSFGKLFEPKQAFSFLLGKMRQKGTCKVHIKYYS